MQIELEVYSHEQWTNRNDPKGCYIVKGDLASLRAYVLRWMERDRARDPEGMTVYHNFDLDPRELLTREELDSLGDALIDFYKLIHPTEFMQCPHGLSLNLCADPINHYPRDM